MSQNTTAKYIAMTDKPSLEGFACDFLSIDAFSSLTSLQKLLEDAE